MAQVSKETPETHTSFSPTETEPRESKFKCGVKSLSRTKWRLPGF